MMLLELSILSALPQSPGNNQGKVSEFWQKSVKRHTFYFQFFVTGMFLTVNDLAPVVQTLDSAIQRIKFIQWIVSSKV